MPVAPRSEENPFGTNQMPSLTPFSEPVNSHVLPFSGQNQFPATPQITQQMAGFPMTPVKSRTMTPASIAMLVLAVFGIIGMLYAAMGSFNSTLRKFDIASSGVTSAISAALGGLVMFFVFALVVLVFSIVSMVRKDSRVFGAVVFAVGLVCAGLCG